MQGKNAPRRNFFCLVKRTFVPTDARPAKLPLLLPDSLHAPSIGGPVLRCAVCFLAFITVQEVFANEALSFRLSALSAVLLLAPRALAQQPAAASRPIKGRLERYLAWYAHHVKGDATPAARTSSEISGIAEGSDLPAEPCSNTIFILNLLARASDCRRE
jgi:hypothetical protein